MFRKDPRGVYVAESLERLGWINHGFGTRQSPDWAPRAQTVTVKQVHSDRVLIAEVAAGCLGEGDAIVTSQPNATLAVRTADCIPLLIADERQRVVAAVHAGWKGTAARIAARAIAALAERFGSRPEELLVAIGPGIGVCCYEVGQDVAAQFEGPERNGGLRVDLDEANFRQAVASGVPASRVSRIRICTHCKEAEFHSWRRDRTEERMISAIAIMT